MKRKLLFVIGFLLTPLLLFSTSSSAALSINGIVPEFGEYMISVVGADGDLGELSSAVDNRTQVGVLRDQYTGNATGRDPYRWYIEISSTNGFHLVGPDEVSGEDVVPYLLEIEWDRINDIWGNNSNWFEPAGSWSSAEDAGERIEKGFAQNNRVPLVERDIFVTVQDFSENLPAGTYRDTITFTLSTN